MSTGPNTFLVGAPKCGTTALAQYLSEHPDVFMGYPKEPSYWSFDLKRGEGVIKLGGLKDYLAIYRQAEGKSTVLDASTSYLYSREAIPAILRFNPNARFIVMLRNPSDMVHAYHMEKCFNLYEDEPEFETAWRLQEARRRGERIPPHCPEPKELQYSEVAALGSQLERVLTHVATDRLLILFQEELSADPAGLWARVCAFLEIDEGDRQDFPVVGAAHHNRYPVLARFYQHPPAWLAPLVRGAKKATRMKLGKVALAKVKGLLITNKRRAALSETFRAELADTFLPEVRKIEQITGRNLSHWKSGLNT